MPGRGKLSLKGDKKSTTKKQSKSKHKVASPDKSNTKLNNTIDTHSDPDEAVKCPVRESDEDLTAAEKKALKFKADQARREMEKVVKLNHRERVEQFNEKLGQLTELNDIPRVSAAGNG